MTNRIKHIKQSRRWVIKIGSALLTQDGKGLDHAAILKWSEQIYKLRKAGIEIILVSSGSVAEGMTRMGWKQRPKALHELQAAAAIGQAGLIQTYEDSFQQYNIHTAQILLTHDDLSNRRRYLNARSTLCTLLSLGALPIVNENDTVAFEELRFGDNDTLGALVSNLIEADILVILTDQQGLYNKDPRQHDDAKLIQEGSANDPSFLQFAGSAGTAIGTGGMLTKIQAAQRAAHSGCATIIASGHENNVLCRLHKGEQLGTLLLPNCKPLAARKRWIASLLQPKGELWLDSGATLAIKKTGRSLLPVGVKKIKGEFERGDVVNCIDTKGNIIARGLVNYSSNDTLKIAGISSNTIADTLGYIDETELIHRDNLVIL
jgi:glutamate 5-kinase